MAVRPAAATTIVPPNTVLAAGVMALEELGPVQLRLMLGGDVRRPMNWLAELGFLHNSYTCPRCQALCSVVVQGASRTNFVGDAVSASIEPACGRVLFSRATCPRES